MKKIIQNFDLYPLVVNNQTRIINFPEDLLFSDKKIERISLLSANYMPYFTTGEKIVPDDFLKYVYFYLFNSEKNNKTRNLSGEFLRINSNLDLTINSKLDFSQCEMKVMRNEVLENGVSYLLPILVYYTDRTKQSFTEPSSSYLIDVSILPNRKFYRLSDFGTYALVGKQINRLQVSGLTDAVITLRTADGFVINQIPLSVFIEDITSENVYLDKTEMDWDNSYIETVKGASGKIFLNFYYVD